MKKVIFVLSLFLLVASFRIGHAGFPNEPNGFREIFFGTHLRELGHLKLEKIMELESEKRYVIRSESLKIGKGEVEKIWYIFNRDRFASVFVGYSSILNFNRLRENFFDTYGKTQRLKHGGSEILVWKGDRVDIFLTFNAKEGDGTVLYSYIPIMGRFDNTNVEKRSKSDSPRSFGGFEKESVEGEIDRNVEDKKEIEKRADLNEAEKMDQKVKADIEYEKRARGIRNRKLMKDELEALKERCQKKLDALREESRRALGWSGSADLSREVEKLRRDCEAEGQQIREYYKVED